MSFTSPDDYRTRGATARRDVSAMSLSDIAVDLVAHGLAPETVWRLPEPPPGVMPEGMAFDDAGFPATQSVNEIYSWAMGGAFSEGLGFLGYQYLAELAQRPEYRRISEIIASEATRKWVKITGNDQDRVKEIDAAMVEFGVRDVFRRISEHDGFFGRGQIFVDLGATVGAELATPLLLSSAKIGRGKLRGFKAVEPFWTYPQGYDTTDPLSPEFYVPTYWHVMGKRIHSSRLLTIVGREVPDILKPAYAFGGLSLSQMAKPYVDNWLRTRQSVSDLVHSFSISVLKTNLSGILSGGAAQSLIARGKLFTQFRDNRGLMMIDNETEELQNVSTPLGTLDALLSISQEQMASVSGIPLVILLGLTPSGLNASSDGEVRAFYSVIKAYQERVFRKTYQRVLDIVQLSEFGEIDPSIRFEFHDLWEMPETDQAAMQKAKTEVDVGYVGAGIISPEEVRERLTQDQTSPFHGLNLASAPPPVPETEGDADGEDA